MKCPKCGYVSHDYLNACRKCSVDLLAFKAQMQLHVVQAGNIDLRSVLGGVQPSPMASGEFEMGESLFDSPMLVEAQAEEGFDISLDDDFSFTPSGMSLESLDGFELSNTDSVQTEQPPPADPDDRPDTGYATVMMDISGLDGEEPPLEPANPAFDAPIEPAEAVIEFPDLPADDALVEPEFTYAELRSSVGRTSALDLTSMELKRTTRDIEMLNQLQNEARSGEVAPPTFEEPAAHDKADPSSAETIVPSLYSSDVSDNTTADLNVPEMDHPATADNDQEGTLPDHTETPFAPTLPESFPEEADGSAPLNDESGELVLPSLDTDFLTAENATPADSAADDPADKFTMPELPSMDAEEEPVNPFTEEISLAIDLLAPPEPPPMEFPSLQTSILPAPTPDETTLVDEASAQAPAQPAAEDEATGSPDTGFTTTELELGNPDLPKPDDAFLTATPEEATVADEPPPPLPVEPTAENDSAASSDTGFATIELDIGDTQPPETPDEAPIFPDLPKQPDALVDPLPEEATIVDEMSPFSSAAHTPADPAAARPDTGFATVELDIGDTQPPEAPDEAPVFPDLPEQTDAFLTPSPEEATIVDEQPPPIPTGHTPVDFTIAPPDTGYATIELDVSDVQQAGASDEAPALPDLPEQTDAFLTPSPDEATIVDEPSPFSTAGRTPADSTRRTEDVAEQPDADDLDEDLDIELIFPDDTIPPPAS